MITAENVEKRYMFKKAIQGSQKKKCAVHALRDICFTISPGETVGLIGKNGAGKSTLLKLISGVTVPDQGRIRVGGRVHALLELGAGFHPEYTGIENLYLNGALHGRSKAQTKALIPKILDFAEIGAYAEQPIKTYSDGMFLRLAFAAAVAEEPEVFVIDEALAVGDVMFQAKCFRRLETMKKQGTTILYVSHDIDSVRRFCDRAIWLDQGRIKMDGAVGDVTAAYLAAVLGDDAKDAVCGRFGSAVGLIQEVNVPPRWTYGRSVTISVRFTLPSDGAEDAALSVSVKNPEGLDLLVLTTRGQQKLTGGTQTAGFRFDSPFLDGDYILAVGLEKSGNAPISYYDYDGFAAKIKTCADGGFGVFHISAEVEAHAE